MQTAVNLTRSHAVFFKHNDMKDLESKMIEVQKKVLSAPLVLPSLSGCGVIAGQEAGQDQAVPSLHCDRGSLSGVLPLG